MVSPAFSSVIGRRVHGALRAQCPLGRGPGPGPTFGRLFRGIPGRRVAPVGNGVALAFTVPARRRMSTWDPVGCVLGLLTGLAAQHRLGKHRRRANPDSGCWTGLKPVERPLSGDPIGFPVCEVPSGRVWHCWGGARLVADLKLADGVFGLSSTMSTTVGKSAADGSARLSGSPTPLGPQPALRRRFGPPLALLQTAGFPHAGSGILLLGLGGVAIWRKGGNGRDGLPSVLASKVQPGPTRPALTQVFKHWRYSLLLQRDRALK